MHTKVTADNIGPFTSLTKLPDAPLLVVCAAAVDVDVFVLVPLVDVDVVVEGEESCVVVDGIITNVWPLLVLRLRLCVVVVTRAVLSPYKQPDSPSMFPQALLTVSPSCTS
jgi:hypothetical protein